MTDIGVGEQMLMLDATHSSGGVAFLTTSRKLVRVPWERVRIVHAIVITLGRRTERCKVSFVRHNLTTVEWSMCEWAMEHTE